MPTALLGPTLGALLLAAMAGTLPCQSAPASAPAPTTGNGIPTPQSSIVITRS